MSLACFYVCGERVSRFSGKLGVSSLVLQMDSFSDLVVVVVVVVVLFGNQYA